MYDIYFDLNDMHQIVDGSPDELSKMYDELAKVAKAQAEHNVFGVDTDWDFIREEDLDDDFAVIVKKPKGNGLTCEHCGDMYPYAEPNLKGGGFKCWSCRNT